MKGIILAIILIVIHILFVYNAHNNGKTFYDDRQKNNKTKPKIFDIGYKYLPDYSQIKNIDIIILVFIFFPLIFHTSSIEEFLTYTSLSNMFRYITINTTILPKDKNCDDTNFNIVNLINGHCYDKIYSGHYASATTISMILYNNNVSLYYILPYNLISALLLISSRSHYTIDIIIGGYVAITTYLLKINTTSLTKFYEKNIINHLL